MNSSRAREGWQVSARGVVRALSICAAALFLTAAPGSTPPGAAQAGLFMPSVAQQKKVGDQAAEQVLQKYREVHNSQSEELQRVGKRLVDALPARDRNTWAFRFHVIQSPEVNAFALPGGSVFMFTGLMDRITSPDELAAVTGHEMGHVRLQHWARAVASQQERQIGLGVVLGLLHANSAIQTIAGLGNSLYNLKYSRSEEDQADAAGLQNMVAAGYNPNGMLDLFHMLQSAAGSGHTPAFLSDHPLTSDRINRTEQRIRQMERDGEYRPSGG